MTTYTPDVWKILEITYEDNTKVSKILAGWYGGYIHGDSWKLSSGITKWSKNKQGYKATNKSGSIYLCNKNTERTSGLTFNMLNTWLTEADKADSGVKIRVLDIELGDKITTIK